MICVVFLAFSWPNNSNFRQAGSYDFFASPPGTQTLQTCLKNRFLGFWAEGWGGVIRLLVPLGQYVLAQPLYSRLLVAFLSCSCFL